MFSSANSPAPFLAVEYVHADRPERLVLSAAPIAHLDVVDAEQWLTELERLRIQRSVAKRRREFVLGRLVAKTALTAYAGVDSLARFEIENGVFEQPIVTGPGGADVSLAHTNDAAVAVAHDRRHPMGIDLEMVDRARLDVIRAHVSPAELPPQTAVGLDEAERLFLLWSVKEALSKALRCGLTCPFSILAASGTTVDNAGVCRGEFVNFGQYQFAAWIAGNHAFALVCSRNVDLAPLVPGLQAFTRGHLGVAPAS